VVGGTGVTPSSSSISLINGKVEVRKSGTAEWVEGFLGMKLGALG
jgi:hypothetical protein